MSGITPSTMDWDSSNLPETWEKFQRHMERDVHQSWTLAADAAKKLKTYYEKIQKHTQPKLNPVFARFRFNNEVQGTDSIDKFVTRLKLKKRDGKFAASEDDMIRDRIVFGTNNQRVREKLINEGEKLTLNKTIQIAQNLEYFMFNSNS